MPMKDRKLTTLLLAIFCMVLTACQYQYVSGSRLGLRDYPDAVVHINQVDPAYRSYFSAQHGSSFSLSDQRKAFTAARQTANTPVKESAYRPAAAPARKKTTARKGKDSARKGKASSRKTKTSAHKTTARKKTSSSKKSSSKSKKRRR